MPLKHAIGIVIQSFDYGESDRIITFYTLEHGKIKEVSSRIEKRKLRKGGSCYEKKTFLWRSFVPRIALFSLSGKGGLG